MRRSRREWENDADQDLVEEILDELLLEWSGGEKTMKIRSEQFGDKVAGCRCERGMEGELDKYVQILKRRDEDIAETDDLGRKMRRERR